MPQRHNPLKVRFSEWNLPFPQACPAADASWQTGRGKAQSAAREDPHKEIQMSMAGNLRKVTGLGRVGGLRKVARLTRRRSRVDLSHPARSPLGSAVVNCVAYEDGV